ncbi:MAG: acyl-CoA dehydrogenase [Chloroflexi bacterium]|nr:acyl-CoA dehydrogenase [Chloroflexota bacterium]
MDFDFTPEQVMLRDLTREILTRESPPSAVRRWIEDPDGFDRTLWRQFAETGLLGVAIPAEDGGQGLGMVDLALVLDEMGRAAYPGPFFATCVLAAPALLAAGQSERLAKIANGSSIATFATSDDGLTWGPEGVQVTARHDGAGYVLAGVKRFVPFAHVADVILVAARTGDPLPPDVTLEQAARGITVFALERGIEGLTVEPMLSIDQGHRTSTLALANVRVGPDAVVGEVGGGWWIVDAALRTAAIGASAEMLGAARKSLELSVEYARVREQFGQPIGMFQAVKHMCAEMLLEVENAHSATYYAAWAYDAVAEDAALASSVAKSYVGEAARKVCGDAIQVHGGIGFTWDYDLHLYFKRAKSLEPLYGDAEHHRARIAALAMVPTAVPALA